jgi:Cu/Ag efflux protein CusF
MRSGIMVLCQRSAICMLLALTAFAATPVATPAQKAKHPIAFAGRVESIDYKMNTVAVQHGPVPGFMPAMTMDYPVENSAVLRQLKPSDEIAATVFVGDPVLHNLHVVKRSETNGPQGTTGSSGQPSQAKPGN